MEIGITVEMLQEPCLLWTIKIYRKYWMETSREFTLVALPKTTGCGPL